jgi:UDP-N-acetylmuramoyl-L-alanyl-D-glutamate--2,6-diaminopimelate ligase
MPLLAEAFYSSKKEMTLIGVTGTNGKTSVATLFFNTIKAMGISCGLLSTVVIKINDNQYPSELTTPDVFTLFRFMKMMRSQGCKHCIMEVSSHAIDQGRIDGLAFDVAAFTNLSHDHLDYHSSFKEYAYTKKKLFDGLSPKSDAIFNADDRNGSVMVQNTRAKKISYGMVMNADYKARILENDFSGMHVRIEEHDFFTRLVGKFNVYNILAVLAIAESVGYERLDVLKALSNVTTAAGRFEIIRSSTENITAIVDYAHTPDALENVLTTISQVNKNKGKIITLIGCGGDRDKTKRPLMAKVAVDLSDSVILTSDNPRSENPDDILDDMEKGIEKTESRKVLRISDRKSAIKTAISIANPKDVILVAGKGHETYQEINGIKHPFDDKQILQEFLLQ